MTPRDSFQNDSRMEESASYSSTNQTDNHFPHVEFTSPAKLKRQVISLSVCLSDTLLLPPLTGIVVTYICVCILPFQSLRQERRAQRTLELIQQDKESDKQMQEAAIHKSMTFENSLVGKYSIWRRDYESPNADAILKLMRDQIIMAKAYAHIAKSKNASNLYLFLTQQSRENQRVLGKATSDADLPSRYLFFFSFITFLCSVTSNLCLILFLFDRLLERLNKQKPWAMLSLLQKTSYMTAMNLQRSFGPCFNPLNAM